jgi:TonB family protein
VTACSRYFIIVFALTASLFSLAPGVLAEDALAEAKELYLSAAYDEALVVLDRLQSEAPQSGTTEVAQYRVFCLLALNRRDEARRGIEGIVNTDPFYRPSESQTPPRVLSVFQATRKALLPVIVQRAYADAKASFDRKDPQAVAQFDRVLKLIDDPDMQGVAQLADLRTVVSGFRDLSQARGTAPPSAAPPAVAPATLGPQIARLPPPGEAPEAPAATPGGPPAGFIPPVAISQRVPPWKPPASVDTRLGLRGSIRIEIDEKGRVESATLEQSVHPLYDDRLLSTARTWKYKPATLNGIPTASSKVVEIQVEPVR